MIIVFLVSKGITLGKIIDAQHQKIVLNLTMVYVFIVLYIFIYQKIKDVQDLKIVYIQMNYMNVLNVKMASIMI